MTIRCAVSAAVIFAILYVLISPLPEVDATAALSKLALILTIWFSLSVLSLTAVSANSNFHTGLARSCDVRSRTCVRLC